MHLVSSLFAVKTGELSEVFQKSSVSIYRHKNCTHVPQTREHPGGQNVSRGEPPTRTLSMERAGTRQRTPKGCRGRRGSGAPRPGSGDRARQGAGARLKFGFSPCVRTWARGQPQPPGCEFHSRPRSRGCCGCLGKDAGGRDRTDDSW